MKEYSLTWEEFEERFKPIPNPYVADTFMYETYGEELEKVRSYPNSQIWTYTDVDFGSGIYNGYHFVNRIGYFITEVPWEEEGEDVYYEVDLQADTCENCDRAFVEDGMSCDDGLCIQCCDCEEGEHGE